MIQNEEIINKSEEFKIHTSNVQRDYIFGWLLNGIYSQSALNSRLILKGGNALRKVYLKNTRFSKDLDFSVLEEIDPNLVKNELNQICRFVQSNTGVEFETDRTRIEEKSGLDKDQKQIYEARVYFNSFYGEEEFVLKIQLDITAFDKIYLPIQSRKLIHPYSDAEFCKVDLKCQKMEEILASKLNTLLQRRKVTDFFDLMYSSLINNDYPINKSELITTFLKKTIYETDPMVAKQLLIKVPLEEYRPFWKNIIAPIFSLFDFDKAVIGFQSLVSELFNFINIPLSTSQTASIPSLRLPGGFAGTPKRYSPFTVTPIVSYFPTGERDTIISSGLANRMISFIYKGFERLVEPYSLKYKVRKKDGAMIEYFYGWDTSGGESGHIGIKSFFYGEMQDIRETNHSFIPRFAVEF